MLLCCELQGNNCQPGVDNGMLNAVKQLQIYLLHWVAIK